MAKGYPWGVSRGFFFKVTYSSRARRVHVYNYGCNLRCAWCFYRLKPPIPARRLSLGEVKEALRRLRGLGARQLNLLGGEPTINPELPELVSYANSLGYRVKVITNGSNRLPKGVHEANVSIKAVSDDILYKLAGCPASRILRNFKAMYERGVRLMASTIYIPGLTDQEVIKVAEFIASIDESIPFHIIGYVPVPGAPWRKPRSEEVRRAAEAAAKLLRNVTWSNVNASDIKYDSVRVL